MGSANSARPPVPAIEDVARPLWSVMIPAYRSERHLPVALDSVLRQDPGPDRMQIEVVDDGSPEDPTPLVESIASGRVPVVRQPENLGNVGNLNDCLRRARGRLVHLLHADDAVRDGFYATMERPFLEHPEIGAAFCRYIAMDGHGCWTNIGPLEQPSAGVLDDWLVKIASGQRLQPPAMVVRRDVYERLGGFDTRVARYGEDWEMWTRIAAHYPVWYEPEPLALYRVHATSLSAASRRAGDNMRDLRRVIDINRDLLPREAAERVSRSAIESSARAAIRRGNRLAHEGDLTGAYRQGVEALRASRSPRVLGGAVGLIARAVRELTRRAREDGGRRI